MTQQTIEFTARWLWMMDYCKAHRLPAAQHWVWEIAAKEYNKMKELQSEVKK